VILNVRKWREIYEPNMNRAGGRVKVMREKIYP